MAKRKSLPKTIATAASTSHQSVAPKVTVTSRPKRTMTSKTVSHSRGNIINMNESEEDGDGLEDEMDLDDDPLTGEQFTSFKSTTKVFKEVAIPLGNSTTDGPLRRGQRVAGTSSSSLSSVGSSVREQSSGYDTPGTSAVVTPAEPAAKRSSTFAPTSKTTFTSPPMTAKVSSSARARQLRSSKLSLNSSTSKRKRQDEATIQEDKDESGDAWLARTLQEEEYQGGSSKRNKLIAHRKVEVGNSSDESDSLSSLSTADAVIPSRRNTKNGARFSLPTRAARDSAKKAIKAKAVVAISDTENSDLTVFDSDEFHSEASDLGSNEELSELEVVPTVSENQVAVPVAIPRRRRRTNAPAGAPTGRRGQAVLLRMSNRALKERKKLESAHPEIKTMWDTLRDVPVICPTQAEQPQAITRKLKSFQLEGLDWMMQQEKSQWKGGLLGDEMGMGKTIQAVSLIMSDYPAKEPTLVVVPPVALMQWQSEIKEYTDGKLKVLIHHNSNPKVKTLKRKDLRGYDVIMISYAGLESMYRKESKGWKRDDGILKEDSVIHSIKFHRLILDEAHSIKARTTGVAKACFALKADYKWCLSGTPVQNRIGEFFSLLRFLEVKPFACYFCKVCECAELHWSRSADMKCTVCHHRGFDHVSIFNQELLTPITQGESPEIRREALGKLRLITDRIMLRRLKRDYTASMELPPKEVIIHQEFFGEIERDFSSSIMTNTHRQFDTYVSRGVMLNNYANIFGLIMQMRQVANHPDLILKKHAEGGQNVLICSICDEPAEEAIRSRCHHEFCRKCAKDYVRSFGDGTDGEPDCPRCHIPLSIDFDQPDIEQDEEHVKKNSIINRIKMEDWTSSTKIEMLVYDLYKLRSQKRTHKSIVFSQFTSMLQLVEWRLRRAGFNTVMLDGSMSPSQRQKSIEYFMNNTDVEVFLVSLKAGGVALNLTEASRVFIIDPWWNPSVEWQSADRCHRIGQKRPCVITRLCIEDSVESRMVLLQEKKANMINGTINNDQVAMEKLTPEDMQFLFRGS